MMYELGVRSIIFSLSAVSRKSLPRSLCMVQLSWIRRKCLLHVGCTRDSVHHDRDAHVDDYHGLLSDENKARAQSKLTKVEPVRTWNDYYLKPEHSYAAVLVPLCTVDGEPSLLFTLRSTKLKKHRGQVSFPGGNVDKDDKDFVHTAFRETDEELGMKMSAFDIWGQMNSLPGSGGRKVVYPILAKAGEIDVSSLDYNHDEVEEVFSVTLKHLCNPANFGTTRFRDGGEFTLPVYTGAAHRIWGLTAVIIHQAMNIVAPDLYKFKVKQRKNHYGGNRKPSTKPRGS